MASLGRRRSARRRRPQDRVLGRYGRWWRPARQRTQHALLHSGGPRNWGGLPRQGLPTGRRRDNRIGEGGRVIVLTMTDRALDVLCLGEKADDIENGRDGTLLRLARRPGCASAGRSSPGTGGMSSRTKSSPTGRGHGVPQSHPDGGRDARRKMEQLDKSLGC